MCVFALGACVAAEPGAPAPASESPTPTSATNAGAESGYATGPGGAVHYTLPACAPNASHPRPVVLVHGTFANRDDNWAFLAPQLIAAGYCVYALNYGATATTAATGNLVYGLGPVADSAAELSAFVDEVLAATGAAQVDIVGHSQGGMMPRYYLKFLGGAANVHALVGFGPSNHGTTLEGITALAAQYPEVASLAVGAWCQSCMDQIEGSPLLAQLNAGGDLVPGVAYTVIASQFDEVVTPYTTQYLAGASVANIHIQDQCAVDVSEHVALAFDPIVARDVLNALDPAHAVAPGCL